MMGCLSKIALGIPTSLDWTMRTKSFSRAALPNDRVTEALLMTGSALAAIDKVPIETAIGCDGDMTALMNEPSGILTSTVILIPPSVWAWLLAKV